MNPNPKVYGLGNSINAGRPVCTSERKHIGSIWSKVTCIPLPIAAAQSLERRALRDYRTLRCLMIEIKNKQYKQRNNQYTKQYLVIKQIVPTDATWRYEHVGARIT
jgi:hypothetical protein